MLVMAAVAVVSLVVSRLMFKRVTTNGIAPKFFLFVNAMGSIIGMLSASVGVALSVQGKSDDTPITPGVLVSVTVVLVVLIIANLAYLFLRPTNMLDSSVDQPSGQEL